MFYESSFHILHDLFFTSSFFLSLLHFFFRTQSPIFLLLMAIVIGEGVNLFFDAFTHHPFAVVNFHDNKARSKFLYLATGGERPLLLHYRARWAAVVTAGCASRRKLVKMKDGRSVEPLFIAPNYAIFMSEVVFLLAFVIVPVFGMLNFGIRYKYTTLTSAFKTVMLFSCMVNVCFSAVLKVILHLWPRAARIYAHLSGNTLIVHANCGPCKNERNNIDSLDFFQVDSYPFLCDDGTTVTTVGAYESLQWEKLSQTKQNSNNNNAKNNANENVENLTAVVDLIDEYINPIVHIRQTMQQQQMQSTSSSELTLSKKSLEVLNDTMRSSYLNPERTPSNIFGVLDTPFDMHWRFCCPKNKARSPPSYYCCENGRVLDTGGKGTTWSDLSTEDLIMAMFKIHSNKFRVFIVLSVIFHILATVVATVVSSRLLGLFSNLYMSLVLVLYSMFMRKVTAGTFGRSVPRFLMIFIVFQHMILLLAETSASSDDTLGEAYQSQFVRKRKQYTNCTQTSTTCIAVDTTNIHSKEGWPAPTYKMLPVCDLELSPTMSVLDAGIMIAGI